MCLFWWKKCGSRESLQSHFLWQGGPIIGMLSLGSLSGKEQSIVIDHELNIEAVDFQSFQLEVFRWWGSHCKSRKIFQGDSNPQVYWFNRDVTPINHFRVLEWIGKKKISKEVRRSFICSKTRKWMRNKIKMTLGRIFVDSPSPSPNPTEKLLTPCNFPNCQHFLCWRGDSFRESVLD